MSTSVWPPIAPADLKKEEEESLSRELSWLLESLQETLASLKSGLEDCYALLAPVEPGSTLVVSSLRSESIKGHITRVGTRITKGTLQLRPKAIIPPTHLTLNTQSPLILDSLTQLRTLLNQSLDCVDITRWTGDRSSATFISSQLHLLHSIINEARSVLKGPLPLDESASSDWCTNPIPSTALSPPLPPNLSLTLSLSEASLVLTVRILEAADAVPDLKSRFAIAFLGPQKVEHDEADRVFTYRGKQVRVKEKIRVESADPSLMAAMAKLSALQHGVGMARCCLATVMGVEMEELSV